MKSLRIFGLFVLLFAWGCEDADSSVDIEIARETDRDSADVDSESTEEPAGSEPERDKPGDGTAEVSGAAPCAQDLDADLHPESFVDEVTAITVPDFGHVEHGPLGRDPSAPGPFSVELVKLQVPIEAQTATVLGREVSIRKGQLAAVVFLPRSKEGLDEPRPLVVTLPGMGSSHRDFDHFGEHLASHGFVVLALATRSSSLVASHDKEALEVLQAVEFMFSPKSPVSGLVDETKIALSGASKGGKIAFLAAALDPRIDIVIGWDPSNAGGPPCSIAPSSLCNAQPVAPNCPAGSSGVLHLMHAETLVFGAPRDPSLNPDRHHNAIHFYRGAPSPASFVQFFGGHDAPKKDASVISLIDEVQTAFLLSRFSGVTDVDSSLPDTASGQERLASLDVVIRVESK